MKWFLPVLLAPLASAGEVPRIVYTKSFPGSAPAFVSIIVDKTGAGEFQDSEKDEYPPLKFQLREAETAEIFGLTDKVGRFTRPLESGLKVAFMGMKTFRFESGAEKAEVKFNFSEDLSARALADWFERITESGLHRINLERAVKYDHLGVFKALLVFESSMDRKRIVAAEQFLPTLDRIAKNETYMHTARVRAAGLADAIRAAK